MLSRESETACNVGPFINVTFAVCLSVRVCVCASVCFSCDDGHICCPFRLLGNKTDPLFFIYIKAEKVMKTRRRRVVFSQFETMS